jgi:hypothetical protein
MSLAGGPGPRARDLGGRHRVGLERLGAAAALRHTRLGAARLFPRRGDVACCFAGGVPEGGRVTPRAARGRYGGAGLPSPAGARSPLLQPATLRS